SGTQSPSLQKAIGMGYIDKGLDKEGTEIYINIRNNKIKAKVVKFPFLK
ncbi:MAG: glycine cleavage system aminomethyltransferase GcvT, partial [Pedobacter sp.]